MYQKTVIHSVQQAIVQNNLLQQGQTVIVGVSGGADSMALLDILLQLQSVNGWRVLCAHLEHGIRGTASMDDLELVRTFCGEKDIPFYHKHADIPAMAAREGKGLEETARAQRYAYFYQLLDEYGAQAIALAHHADDQAETVLMKLIRGAGTKGLGGMQSRRGAIIRPLLSLTKDQLIGYCREAGILYAEDATNKDTEYTRNKIRHQVLPLLRELNPEITDALFRTALLCQEDERCLDEMANVQAKQLMSQTDADVRLNVPLLIQLPKALSSRVLRKAISAAGLKQDIAWAHLEELLNVLRHSGAEVQLPRGLRAQVSYNQLIFHYGQAEPEFSPQALSEGRVQTPLGQIEIAYKSSIVDFLPNRELLDATKLPMGIQLRLIQPGDRITPLGMTGTKSLKDYLSDKKIGQFVRRRLVVLAKDQTVYWVEHTGIAQSVRVDTNTKEIVQITTLEEYK